MRPRPTRHRGCAHFSPQSFATSHYGGAEGPGQELLGLPQVVTVPDATLLGDGSRHREATSRAKVQPAAKAAAGKPSGGGGGNGGRNRQRTRTRDGEDRAARRDTRRDDRPARDGNTPHARTKPAERRGADGVVDVDRRLRKQREGGAPKVHRKGGGTKVRRP